MIVRSARAAEREAADPTTAVQQLERLSRHPSRPVRAAVVSNPNTSLRVLGRLGGTFARELAQNPLLAWLHVEDADFLARFPRIVRHRVLMMADGGLLWWAARFGDDDDHRALLANPAAPTDLVRWLIDNATPEVATAARSHVNCPDPSLDMAPWPTAGGREFEDLVATDLLPDWLLPAAVVSADSDIRRAVLGKADLPAGCVDALLFDVDEGIRQVAARHANASPELLRFLAAVDDLAAPLPSFPDEVFARLLDSPTARGAFRLARRHDLPVDLVRRLAGSDDWTVRQAIAASPSLDPDLALDLALDTDRDVRVALVSNPQCPAVLVGLLRNDGDAMVMAACPPVSAEVSRALVDTLEARGERGRVVAAGQAKAGRGRLTRLAGDTDWRVRHAVAGNPATPGRVLARLALDPDRDVRAAVAANRTASAATRRRLVADRDDRVRMAVVSVATEPDVVARIGDETETAVLTAAVGNPLLPDDMVLAFVRRGDKATARAAADRAKISADLFTELAATDDDELRLQLLRRTDTPHMVVARLLGPHPERAHHARAAVTAPESLASAALTALLVDAPWITPALVEADPMLPGVVAALAVSVEWRLRQRAAILTEDPDLLTALAQDGDLDVRQAVIRNAATAPTVLDGMVHDQSAAVRRTLMERAELSASSVTALIDDEDSDVRAAALDHANCPPLLARQHRALEEGRRVPAALLARAAKGTMASRLIAARHPQVGLTGLHRLSQDAFWQVREIVAQNPAAPPDILRALAADDDRDVRRAVAAHPRVPGDVLKALLADGSDMVRKQAVLHPALPEDIRESLVVGLLHRSIRSGSAGARVAAAASSRLPDLARQRRSLWQSLDWWTRYAVARNPNTTVAMLSDLAHDGDVRVRRAARHCLETRPR